MALRLVTSVYFIAPFLIQLACSACGSARHSGNAGSAQGSEGLAQVSCDACGADAACNSLEVCTPAAWYCGPTYYNAGAADGCDCDCGVPDPDCALPNVERWCYGAGRPYKVAECGTCRAGEG